LETVTGTTERIDTSIYSEKHDLLDLIMGNEERGDDHTKTQTHTHTNTSVC
jgi:hypothetical protein